MEFYFSMLEHVMKVDNIELGRALFFKLCEALDS